MERTRAGCAGACQRGGTGWDRAHRIMVPLHRILLNIHPVCPGFPLSTCKPSKRKQDSVAGPNGHARLLSGRLAWRARVRVQKVGSGRISQIANRNICLTLPQRHGSPDTLQNRVSILWQDLCMWLAPNGLPELDSVCHTMSYTSVRDPD